MKKLTWLLTLWLGLAASAFAIDTEVAFDDPVLQERYRSLIARDSLPEMFEREHRGVRCAGRRGPAP